MKAILFFILFTYSFASTANNPLFNDPKAKSLVDRIGPDLLRRMVHRKVVYGIGVSTCDPVTGRQNTDLNSVSAVPCVVILVETPELKSELSDIYGNQIDGVFVVYLVTGTIQQESGTAMCEDPLK